MPETFNARISELASRASSSATLDEAEALRMRSNRRIWRRRGGGALLGAAAVAAAVSLGVAMTGSSTTPQTTAASQTTPSPTTSPQTSSPPTSTAEKSLSPSARAHKVQIQEQLEVTKSFTVGDSSYAVIFKGAGYAYEANFFAGAHSTTVVANCGATWAQVVAANLKHGFTNVTTRTQASSTLPTDAVIDIQNSAGVSVVGQRIPLTTPLVLIAAG